MVLPAWAALAVGLASAPAGADAPAQLVLNWRGVPDPGLTTLIAEVGAPVPVTVSAGERPYDFILDRCGANLAYLALVQKAEPDLDLFAPVAATRALALPACLGPGDPARVEARTGDTMQTLAREVGVAFRPYTTDWSDLPGVPVAEETARLTTVDRLIEQLAAGQIGPIRSPDLVELPVFERASDPANPFQAPLAFDGGPEPEEGTVVFTSRPQPSPLQLIQPASRVEDLGGRGVSLDDLMAPQLNVPATSDQPTILFPSGQPAFQFPEVEPRRDIALDTTPMVEALQRSLAAQGLAQPGNSLADASVDLASLLTLRLEPRMTPPDPGRDTPAALETWRKAQTTFAGLVNNAGIRIDNGLTSSFPIASGQRYVLPDVTPRWQAIPLKPDLSPDDFLQVYQRLASADATTAQAFAAANIDIVSAPRHFHNIDNQACGPRTGRPAIDAAAIVLQLGLNEKLRLERGWPASATTPAILVLDNGFPEIAAPQLARIWPEDDKVYLRLVRTGSHQAMSAGQFVPPSPVVNVATQSLATEVPENYPEAAGTRPSGRWHGLAVTMTAFGGTEFEPFRLVMRNPIRIGFAGMIDPRGLLASTVNEAVKLANRAQVRVINASFSFPDKPTNLEDAIDNLDRSTILVVAAGNDGANLDDISIYPPKFGGRSVEAGGKTVITVGMSRHDGTLHPKSNWSATYVDLLAPGCDIPSYGIEGEGQDRRLVPARWTGTSFAAPLVTFTVGLLARTIAEAPVIKARLINSVDFSPPVDANGNPHQTTIASGVLNIERALAFPFNQFILADGRRLLDTASNDDRPAVRLCGQDFAFGRVARLSIREGRLYYRNQSNTPSDGQILELKSCALAPDDALAFDLVDYATGLPATVTLGELADFIALEPGVTP